MTHRPFSLALFFFLHAFYNRNLSLNHPRAFWRSSPARGTRSWLRLACTSLDHRSIRIKLCRLTLSWMVLNKQSFGIEILIERFFYARKSCLPFFLRWSIEPLTMETSYKSRWVDFSSMIGRVLMTWKFLLYELWGNIKIDTFFLNIADFKASFLGTSGKLKINFI